MIAAAWARPVMQGFPLLRKLGTLLRLLWQRPGAIWDRLRQQPRLLRLQWAGSRPFRTRIHGYPFLVHPARADSRDLYLNAQMDADEIDVLRRWLGRGGTLLDIGANLGAYGIPLASASGAGGRVWMVEASAGLAQLLRSDVQALGLHGVEVIEAAVCAHTGTVQFHQAAAGAQTVTQSLRPDGTLATAVPVTVAALTLQDLATRIGALPDVIKLDIEGAEVDALAQVPAAWLSAHGPLWLVEINPEALARFEHRPEEVLAAFPDAQFERWWLPRHPHAVAASRSTGFEPLPAHPDWQSAVYFNLLAIPRQSASRPRLTARLGALYPHSS